MLELRNRVILENDDTCCLCGKRLSMDSEAYRGFVPESDEERTICERCAVLDENAGIDLSYPADLLSELYEIGYFSCDCGSLNLNVTLDPDDEDVAVVTCNACGKVCKVPIDAASLEDYFIANASEKDSDYDDGDFGNEDDDDDAEYTAEELELYTDDYMPDTDYMKEIFNSADNPFKGIRKK